jgi:hypothetical protein
MMSGGPVRRAMEGELCLGTGNQHVPAADGVNRLLQAPCTADARDLPLFKPGRKRDPSLETAAIWQMSYYIAQPRSLFRHADQDRRRNRTNKQGVGTLFGVVDGNLITCRTRPDGYPGVLALMAIMEGDPSV